MDILKNAESVKKFLDVCETGDPLKDFYDEDDLARALITLLNTPPAMSLSEIIAQLEPNESVKFTRHATSIRVIVKKGDHPRNNKTVVFHAEPSDIDVIERGVERTLHEMRNPIT